VKPLVWMRAVRDASPPTSAQLAVLWALALRMRPDGSGFTSTRQLCDDVTVSHSTVERATRWARETSWLDRVRRGHRLGNGVRVGTEWRLTEPSQPVTTDTLSDSQSLTGDGFGDSQSLNSASQSLSREPPEVSVPEIPSKTLLVTTGLAPPNADNGGQEPHRNEPNARRAIGTLVAARTLPFTEDTLMLVAYQVGGGDPWTGYLTIKAATEQSFTGARDPLAVLRKRLRLS